MNKYTYLIIPDLDNMIIAHMDPGTILRMSAVNKHFQSVCEIKRILINEIGDNFDIACEDGHLCIAKWIVERQEQKVKKGDKIPLFQQSSHMDTTVIHEYSDSLFHDVCSNGHIDIAKWLVELCEKYQDRINIHAENEQPFRSVCEYGHLDIAKWLIKIGEETYGRINIDAISPNNGHTPLLVACMNGRIEIAKWLISLEGTFGTKINIHYNNEYIFYNACMYGKLEACKWLIKLGEKSHGKIDIHADNEWPFMSSCGDLPLVKYLIELGENGYGKFNIHINKEKAFRYACRNKTTDVAEYLIELGENGYGKIDIHAKKDKAFHNAIQYTNYDMMKYLYCLSTEKSYGKIMLNWYSDAFKSYGYVLKDQRDDIHQLLTIIRKEMDD